MRSPREFLSGEFLKVKYTRRLSTEYPPELRQVPGPIESTVRSNDRHLVGLEPAYIKLMIRVVCLLKLANKSPDKSEEIVRQNSSLVNIPDSNLEDGQVSSPSPMISSLALR